jgi:hypothetical protein
MVLVLEIILRIPFSFFILEAQILFAILKDENN